MRSDGKPGFNPYRKHPLDVYEHGQAFLNGTEPQDFSLDMQVIEYEPGVAGHEEAVRGPELLKAGGFEKDEDWSTPGASTGAKVRISAWRPNLGERACCGFRGRRRCLMRW